MQVLVALENVIRTFTFPSDSSFKLNSPQGFVQIIPSHGSSSWFNMAYVIAITPGTKAGA